MTAFDHVTTLLSFVYALALTHLLSRIGTLVLGRERVRFSGLQALAMANAVVQVLLSWLYLWDARTAKDVDLITIVVGFLYAITVYFICVAAAPEPSDGAVDLEAFYWRNRRVYYGVYGLATAVALASVWTPDQRQSYQAELATLPFFAPCLLALTVPARWAQWVAGGALFAISLGWLLLFSRALH